MFQPGSYVKDLFTREMTTKRLNKTDVKRLILAEIGYREPAERPEESEERVIPDPRRFPTSEDAKVLRSLDFRQTTNASGRLTFIATIPWIGNKNFGARFDIRVTNYGSEWKVNYELVVHPHYAKRRGIKGFMLDASGSSVKKALENIIQQGKSGPYEIAPLVKALEPSNLNRLLEYLLKEETTTSRVKYPRTFHLPWSPGATDDDKRHTLEDIEKMFGGKEVVITEKMDGENTTIYSTGECHARSLDSAGHPSRDYVRGKAHEIGCMGFPKGWRIMGENLYAKHSISYDLLPDFFVIFGIADDSNTSRPWSEVEEWSDLLGLPHAPVLWKGIWDTEKVMSLYPFKSLMSSEGTSEGYVVRVAGAFPMDDFSRYVAKFVRASHVQTDTHWMQAAVVPNKRLTEHSLFENISLDLDVGDIVLGGKWKNKRIVVKSIGKDELGQPTINGQSLLAMRIEKLMPDEKKSKKTREEEEEEDL